MRSNPLCVPGLFDPETFDSSIKSPENTYKTAAKVRVLVENGDADDYVPDEGIAAWKKEMDAAGVDWVWYADPLASASAPRARHRVGGIR